MIRSLFFTTGLLALAACAPPTFNERVDERLSAYAGERPGVAIRIILGRDVVLERTLGVARVDARTPIDSDTNFRLASITKHFTALAVLILVDEGRLSLETRLSEVFPDFPPYANAISIRHLLQHQSGLPDYEPLVPETQTPRVRDQAVLELLINQSALDFEPGSQYHYSNSGYAVLAQIVEAIAKTPFQTFLADRIFTPSGLDQTVALVDGINAVNHRALGYTIKQDVIEERDQSPYSAVLGDGGVYSSLTDLTTWHLMGFGQRLISPALFSAMHEPALEDYGFGWRIDQFAGRIRYHHSGSTSGFRHFLAHFPESNLTLILLTNRAAPDVRPLGEAILADYFEAGQ